MEDALTLLRKAGSLFNIIIIEQCPLGANEFELLRIGKELTLPVIGNYKAWVIIYIFSVSLTCYVNLTSQYL